MVVHAMAIQLNSEAILSVFLCYDWKVDYKHSATVRGEIPNIPLITFRNPQHRCMKEKYL